MVSPWLSVTPLTADDAARVRRRAIFDCCKWDPQAEDVQVVSDAPLVLTQEAWRELRDVAQRLARETLAAEVELLRRPDLHRALALPRRVRAALKQVPRQGATTGAARLIRFDFHHTSEGWRISEANTDVPGGLNEASGFPGLMLPHYPGTCPIGDPAGAYVEALLATVPTPYPVVALVHATAYSDDRQVMTYLARRLMDAGASAHLVSPLNVEWCAGRAFRRAGSGREPVDMIVRFFPAEWLVDLPRARSWQPYFSGGLTPVSNPPTAIVTQSKRLPLVWDQLETRMDAWRAVLPETRDPRNVPRGEKEQWVLKPALGRVGEDVAIAGVATPKEWRLAERAAARDPRQWVAQRRFEATRLGGDDDGSYPCVGVFTVGERVVGAYGRTARRPLIDWRAQDMAILAVGPDGVIRGDRS